MADTPTLEQIAQALWDASESFTEEGPRGFGAAPKPVLMAMAEAVADLYVPAVEPRSSGEREAEIRAVVLEAINRGNASLLQAAPTIADDATRKITALLRQRETTPYDECPHLEWTDGGVCKDCGLDPAPLEGVDKTMHELERAIDDEEPPTARDSDDLWSMLYETCFELARGSYARPNERAQAAASYLAGRLREAPQGATGTAQTATASLPKVRCDRCKYITEQIFGFAEGAAHLDCSGTFRRFVAEGSPQPAEPRENRRSWWLIERRQSDGPVWWTGTGWTSDANAAYRISRKQACEREIDTQGLRSGEVPFGVATEHIWIDADFYRGTEYAGAAEGGDTLTPETPPLEQRMVAYLRELVDRCDLGVSSDVSLNFLEATDLADRLEAQAGRIAELGNALGNIIDLADDSYIVPAEAIAEARRALVGEEAL